MSFNHEETFPGIEAGRDDIFINSLQGLSRLVHSKQGTSEFEKTLRAHTKISSERWRDNICTAERVIDTKVSLSPSLCIHPDDLLSTQEVEQRRLRRMYFQKFFDINTSRKIDYTLVNFEQIEKNYAEPQSKMAATREGSKDKQKQQESSSQTTEDNLGTSETSTELSPSEPLRGTDPTSTDASPSEPPKGTDASKKTKIDDHVFAMPAIPTQRSSVRIKKNTVKDPQKSDQSEKSKSTSDVQSGRYPTRRTASRDTPDPRRSARLSSQSASEADDDADTGERKSRIDSSRRTTSKTKPGHKERKEGESSGGDESADDSRRSTSVTRASRRIRK